MKERMYAYLMHLSDNMWGDPGARQQTSTYSPVLLADENVWRETIDYLPSQGINTVLIDIGDAIQYESHPEIVVQGAWSKDKFKMELDRMRAMGLTPLPKLNFSAGHDPWMGVYSRMLSTPLYYEFCKDIIHEVCELFDYPKYFHLGMDEEKVENQKTLSFLCVRQGDLWWHDSYYLFDLCEKEGARPWVWADYCWREPQEYVKRMPKSVLQSNFWYNKIRKNPDGSYKDVTYGTYRVLEEAGFDQVLCCSTIEGYRLSAMETLQLGRDEIAPERLVGYMTAPWCNPLKDCELFLKHDALQLGAAKRAIYPEDEK